MQTTFSIITAPFYNAISSMAVHGPPLIISIGPCLAELSVADWELHYR